MLNYPQSQEAISIAEMAEGIIASSPIPKNEMLDRALILSEGDHSFLDG